MRIAKNSIITIYGRRACGKTILMLDIINNMHHLHNYVLAPDSMLNTMPHIHVVNNPDDITIVQNDTLIVMDSKTDTHYSNCTMIYLHQYHNLNVNITPDYMFISSLEVVDYISYIKKLIILPQTDINNIITASLTLPLYSFIMFDIANKSYSYYKINYSQTIEQEVQEVLEVQEESNDSEKFVYDDIYYDDAPEFPPYEHYFSHNNGNLPKSYQDDVLNNMNEEDAFNNEEEQVNECHEHDDYW
jgi:hypothetical protein